MSLSSPATAIFPRHSKTAGFVWWFLSCLFRREYGTYPTTYLKAFNSSSEKEVVELGVGVVIAALESELLAK